MAGSNEQRTKAGNKIFTLLANSVTWPKPTQAQVNWGCWLMPIP